MDSAMIVIFGSTGDLTKRKLIPALYHLHRKGQLHACTPIVAVGRKPLDDASFIEQLDVNTFLKGAKEEDLQSFLKNVKYLHLDIGNTDSQALKKAIEDFEKKHSCSRNKLFYLAVPPSLFDPITRLIEPLRHEEGWQRVVFEKPFGHDVKSASRLNACVTKVFDEEDIFRIDHYLGKALVQNMFTFRFSNPLFENSWNSEYIDHIEIVASEDLGVESRAGYYDKNGALLDMVQNHLLQLLSLVAMDTPASLDAEDIRDETVKVMRSLRLDSWTRGQYVEGDGKRGYREEPGVAPDSGTETFVRLKLLIDNERWKGTPFIIRTGKRLKRRNAYVKAYFRHTGLYKDASQNALTIRIQPDEGIAFSFNTKDPENGKVEQVHMDFCHPCHFGPNTAEAYEALLAEVLKGNHTLFTRWDWLQASWEFIDGIRKDEPGLRFYPAGSDGPS